MRSEAALSLTSRPVVGHLDAAASEPQAHSLSEGDGFHREQEREGNV